MSGTGGRGVRGRLLISQGFLLGWWKCLGVANVVTPLNATHGKFYVLFHNKKKKKEKRV